MVLYYLSILESQQVLDYSLEEVNLNIGGDKEI